MVASQVGSGRRKRNTHTDHLAGMRARLLSLKCFLWLSQTCRHVVSRVREVADKVHASKISASPILQNAASIVETSCEKLSTVLSSFPGMGLRLPNRMQIPAQCSA